MLTPAVTCGNSAAAATGAGAYSGSAADTKYNGEVALTCDTTAGYFGTATLTCQDTGSWLVKGVGCLKGAREAWAGAGEWPTAHAPRMRAGTRGQPAGGENLVDGLAAQLPAYAHCCCSPPHPPPPSPHHTHPNTVPTAPLPRLQHGEHRD